MKILSAAQMKQADAQTITGQHITSLDLMERASNAIFEQLTADFKDFKGSFTILCGAGNNGGDGLALARMLYNVNFSVRVFLLRHDKYSVDNHSNQLRLSELGIPIEQFDLSTVFYFPENTTIVDCLFGYGLTRPLDTDWAYIIQQINEQPSPVISIDLPSGLLADQHTDARHPIVKAHLTYTFHCPKLALLLPENAPYSGQFKILDIGLEETFIHELPTAYIYSEKKEIVQFVPPAQKYAHKGTYGHALIAGGSYGKIGATVLSSKASLRTGCGLVTTYIPRCGYSILQSAFPEAMVMTDPDHDALSTFPKDLSPFDAIGVGIGMGTSEQSQHALKALLQAFTKMEKVPALVLDADALNILSLHPEWLSSIPSKSILTPHPKELQRLIGPWENDFDKLQKAKAFSTQYDLITLIKGAHTAVICPNGQIHFNATGNWGMATAGSGDVLTGVLTSLLAQGLQPEHAAITGVFLHGLAGDIATQHLHPKSLIASDLIAHLSDAWGAIAG